MHASEKLADPWSGISLWNWLMLFVVSYDGGLVAPMRQSLSTLIQKDLSLPLKRSWVMMALVCRIGGLVNGPTKVIK